MFDSGIGGLSVANAIIQLLPEEQLIYFGDTAHIPYGTRLPDTVRQFCRQITAFLLAKNCKLIVVACNTATAAALEDLRAQWPEVHFVGMEPAIKPGALFTKSGKVGVMATNGTLKSQRYAALNDLYAQDVEVFENPCIGLVELIESGASQKKKLRQYLDGILLPLVEKEIDTLVLGCTHYPLIKAQIAESVGTSVHIIDPAPAIARQVKRVLEKQKALAFGKTKPFTHQFYVSGDLETFRRNLVLYFPAPAQAFSANL